MTATAESALGLRPVQASTVPVRAAANETRRASPSAASAVRGPSAWLKLSRARRTGPSLPPRTRVPHRRAALSRTVIAGPTGGAHGLRSEFGMRPDRGTVTAIGASSVRWTAAERRWSERFSAVVHPPVCAAPNLLAAMVHTSSASVRRPPLSSSLQLDASPPTPPSVSDTPSPVTVSACTVARADDGRLAGGVHRPHVAGRDDRHLALRRPCVRPPGAALLRRMRPFDRHPRLPPEEPGACGTMLTP